MFKLHIIDLNQAAVVFAGTAKCVCLPSQEGELSILEDHQPLAACLKEGILVVDEDHSICVQKGIARMDGEELTILIER